MMRPFSYCQGFLLIELCIAFVILGILSTTIACVHSHLFQMRYATRDELRLLFFTRSCIEEYKAFGRIESHDKSYTIELRAVPSCMPDYRDVTVRVTQKLSTIKRSSYELSARILCHNSQLRKQGQL